MGLAGADSTCDTEARRLTLFVRSVYVGWGGVVCLVYLHDRIVELFASTYVRVDTLQDDIHPQANTRLRRRSPLESNGGPRTIGSMYIADEGSRGERSMQPPVSLGLARPGGIRGGSQVRGRKRRELLISCSSGCRGCDEPVARGMREGDWWCWIHSTPHWTGVGNGRMHGTGQEEIHTYIHTYIVDMHGCGRRDIRAGVCSSRGMLWMGSARRPASISSVDMCTHNQLPPRCPIPSRKFLPR